MNSPLDDHNRYLLGDVEATVRHSRVVAASRWARVPGILVLLVPWTVATAVSLLVVSVAYAAGVAPETMFRDAFAVAAETGRSNPMYGLVSNLGVLLTAAVAGAAVAARFLMARESPTAAFLGWTAAFAAVFAGDDLAGLHEALSDRVPGGDLAVVAVLGVLLVGMLWHGRAGAAGARPGLLVIMLVSFGGSFGADQLDELLGLTSNTVVIVEDTLKLAGILALTGCVGSAVRRPVMS